MRLRKKAMNQRGFTLVEIAIVMVIIGLLLAGIVGGQSLIRSTQAKDVISIVDDLRTATAYFKQRYHYLPGDLPFTAGEIINITAAGTGGTIGNGLIEGVINAAGQAAAGSEVAEAPWQLFNAGFLGKIDNNDTQRRIRTAFGAVHLVSAGNSGVAFPANGPIRNVIVFANLPCNIVDEVDRKIDDGVTTTGRAMGNACVNDVVARYAVAL